jgi:hypothetical protein
VNRTSSGWVVSGHIVLAMSSAPISVLVTSVMVNGRSFGGGVQGLRRLLPETSDVFASQPVDMPVGGGNTSLSAATI